MVQIIYLSWNPYLKLLYMSWNFYGKNVECFISKPNAPEIFWYKLKLIKWVSRKLMNQLNFQNLTSHLISLSKFNLPLLYVTYAARALQGHDLSGEGIKLWVTDILFLTTQGHGESPRMSDQPNAGATSETAQTWKAIHTKHTLSHPYKANMEWWLRRPNDFRGPWGTV